MMKFTKHTLIAFTLVVAACSSDDEPKNKLDTTKLSLATEAKVIDIPTGLAQATDPYAQQTTSFLAMANSMSGYFAFMTVPGNATKGGSKITASNGRTKDVGDYVTYTYTDAATGNSIAYQIEEQADDYIFELFINVPDEIDWLKYYHAEEKKDGSSGFMRVYDIFGAYGDDPSLVWLKYDWTRSGDILHLVITNYDEDFYIDYVVNEATQSGIIEFYEDGELIQTFTWDAAGNGTWEVYEDGEVVEEGTWTAGD